MTQTPNPDRVFVVGATCPTGVELCHQLRERGARVLAGVRSRERAREYLPEFEHVRVDCERSPDLAPASEYPYIVHLAGMRYATNVIRACAGHNHLRRIVFVSSTRIHYPDASLTRSERELNRVLRGEEEAVTASQLPWVVVRPTLIFSARDRSLSRVVSAMSARAWFPCAGLGHARKQPLASGDLASTLLTALTAKEAVGRTYDVPGRTVAVNEILRGIAGALDKRVRLIPIPRGIVRAVGGAAGVMGMRRVARRAAAMERWYDSTLFDIAAAERDLSHSPGEFASRLREMVGEWQARRNGPR